MYLFLEPSEDELANLDISGYAADALQEVVEQKGHTWKDFAVAGGGGGAGQARTAAERLLGVAPRIVDHRLSLAALGLPPLDRDRVAARTSAGEWWKLWETSAMACMGRSFQESPNV